MLGVRIPLSSPVLAQKLQSVELISQPRLHPSVVRFRPLIARYIRHRLRDNTFFEDLRYRHHFTLGTRPLGRKRLFEVLRKFNVQMRSYPAHAPFNFEVLELSVKIAQAKGYQVVLMDLPRNPTTERVLYAAYLPDYDARLEDLVRRTGAVRRNLHRESRLPPNFFYDHIHLLDGARVTFQKHFVSMLLDYL